MLKKFRNLLIFIAVVLALGVVVMAVSVIRSGHAGKKEIKVYEEAVSETYKSMGFDRFEDQLALEQSDIAGWTKLDKHRHGLSHLDGSDTDGDGLTDREEIETYRTDPLKKSTAGDFYTDGYKVSKGYDPKAYIAYNGTVSLRTNKCPEVQFTVSNADDLNAGAVDMTESAKSEPVSDLFPWTGDYLVYKIYEINRYHRDSLDIDISGVGLDDGFTVLAGFLGTEPEKADYTRDGDLVTVSYPFSDQNIVAFVKKRPLFSFDSAAAVEDENAEGGETEEYREPKMLIRDFLMLCLIPTHKPVVYYVKGTDSAENNAMSKAVVQAYRYNYVRNKDNWTQLTADDFKEITPEEYERKLGLLKKYFPTRGNPYRDVSDTADMAVRDLSCLSFYYLTYDYLKYGPKPPGFDNCASDNYPIIDDRPAASQSAKKQALPGENVLDITGATLPFQNFGSFISTGGNCAGIAHLTSLLYNTGINYQSGSSDITGVGNITWDLSADPDNATLMDTGLSDYKDSMFMLNHLSTGVMMDKGLTPGEQEFVKMIGCYWAKGNGFSSDESYRRKNGENNYSYELVNKMKKYIDEGKMLDVYIGTPDGKGHVINAYGYKDTVAGDGSEITEIMVYDSNFPGNRTPSGKSINNTLKLVKVYPDYGYKESFSFFYMPLLGGPVTTNLASNGEYSFIVFDENWTCLNDMVYREVPYYKPYGE